jgi:hypothetical protein
MLLLLLLHVPMWSGCADRAGDQDGDGGGRRRLLLCLRLDAEQLVQAQVDVLALRLEVRLGGDCPD